jgi:hypothetical protein
VIADTTLAGDAAIVAVCHGCGAIGPPTPGTRSNKQAAANAARKIGWTADRWGDVTTCSTCAGTVATPQARPPPDG